MACERGYATAVWQLLKHPDIRVNQKDFKRDGSEGFTALDYCRRVKNIGARVNTLEEFWLHPGLHRGGILSSRMEISRLLSMSISYMSRINLRSP